MAARTKKPDPLVQAVAEAAVYAWLCDIAAILQSQTVDCVEFDVCTNPNEAVTLAITMVSAKPENWS